MNTAEVVERKMQSNGSFQVRELLAESIRQARQSAHLHSHGEVLPFHVRRADMGRVGISESDSGYNLREPWWGVPPVGIVLPIISKQFGELREVNVHAEALRDGLLV